MLIFFSKGDRNLYTKVRSPVRHSDAFTLNYGNECKWFLESV
ncbi:MULTISPECIES: hypothetical protein [unclassified Nostoc]|nr:MULTISPECIES: hypothetical protein [unclassified Nostoc]